VKLLVIPDVHNRIGDPEALIKRFPEYQPVFLGDYFDSYHDGPEVARETAAWLRYSIHAGRIHLMGNHDLPYRWQYQNTTYQVCPGWTREKQREVNSIMKADDWQLVRLMFILGQGVEGRPLVLSHAGITLANLYGVPDYRDVAKGGRCEHLRERLPQEYLADIRSASGTALIAAYRQSPHFWFNQGDRMGELEEGGPFWIDKDSFRSPPAGIDQIVGHSHVSAPIRSCVPNQAKAESEVWFIDGGGAFAALVDNDIGKWRVTPIHARGSRAGETFET